MLPLKAVILNLVSLGAAYGIVVFIFQWGHGSQAIWNVPATNSIIPWIPLMIFAFLYGLSMDYEVFMLTRMREAYDETGDTSQAIALGLSRTGKLVTSAALVLCLAFFVLSTSPGTDIKQFGIGLSAGVIFDATSSVRSSCRRSCSSSAAGTGCSRVRSRGCCSPSRAPRRLRTQTGETARPDGAARSLHTVVERAVEAVTATSIGASSPTHSVSASSPPAATPENESTGVVGTRPCSASARQRPAESRR